MCVGLPAVFLVVFGFYPTLMDAMEQTDSHRLDVALAHFKEVRARALNLSVDVRKGKMTTYCSSEWAAFEVGWPPERTFHLPTVLAAEDSVPKGTGAP